MSARRCGDGFSLALVTGPNTHLTLVYFNMCRRGYEQNLAKQMAIDYFRSKNLTNVDLILGERHNERSVCVHGIIEKIILDLCDVFSKFDIDRNQIPHIDLRGTDIKFINTRVSLIDNFTY